MPPKKKYEVILFRPEFLKEQNKRVARCLMCGLRYSIKDYETLFVAKKLAYFDVSALHFWDPSEEQFLDKKWAITCHDCLYKIVLKLGGGKIVKVNVIDGEKAYTCNFYPDKDGDFLGGLE